MLSLDEAIQYAKALGIEEENKIDYDKDSPHMIICRKNTVKDYRQLAEWLTELKELRAENKVLISEVADVLIMAQQMKMYLGAEKVNAEIQRKLDRQIERIKAEGNNEV